MRTRILIAFLMLPALLGSAGSLGCHQVRGAEAAAANVLISPEDEKQIGKQVQDELEQKVRFVSDRVVVRYVDGVAAPVFAEVKKRYPEQSLDLRIIDDPKTVNAFAIPGGHIYVESGLILAADNAAELAGVIAHETGHVALDHPGRQMVAQFGLETLASLALGQQPALAEKIAASIATNGLLLANSRADEQEADTFGVRYASAANYDPQGLVRFLGKIQKLESGKSPPVWLSDHPTTESRIRDLRQYIAANHLTGSIEGGVDMQTIQSRLAPKGRPQSDR
jgi:predicted Zn-dependent protease